MIGETLYEYDHGIQGTSDWDILKTVLFYIFVFFIRFMFMIPLQPILTRIGYEVSFKDVLMISYGGIRGALALALGLMISVDTNFRRGFRSITSLMVTSVIFFTVMINSTTITLFAKLIGFG